MVFYFLYLLPNDEASYIAPHTILQIAPGFLPFDMYHQPRLSMTFCLLGDWDLEFSEAWSMESNIPITCCGSDFFFKSPSETLNKNICFFSFPDGD